MKRTIILGADHAGFALKVRIGEELKRRGFSVEDLSPTFKEGDDYPRIGRRVAKHVVTSKDKALGILVCGSGVGMVIAANRVKGARASVGHDAREVIRGREDDHTNILALSGWKTSLPMAMGMITAFTKTSPSKAKRHVRRVKELG